MIFTKFLKKLLIIFWEILLIIPLAILSLLLRFKIKPIDVGLGPQPLVSYIHHKNALIKYGYSAETFVDNVYYITDNFDVRFDRYRRYSKVFWGIYSFIFVLSKYKILYMNFNGGLIGKTVVLWRLEPLFYYLSGIGTIILPYGSDVQIMSLSKNLLFKHTLSKDYPQHYKGHRRVAAKVDLWTRFASHIVSGCEWVDYMYYWDTLMLAHFSIDTELWKPSAGSPDQGLRPGDEPVRILHAPNHTNIKGTAHFLDAVEALKTEGYRIELVVLQRVTNDQVRETMRDVDLVADQLIIGWYAMFALEAMAMEKPVLCCLRQDLLDLYTEAGLIEKDEIPIINCTPFNVQDVLRHLLDHRSNFAEIGSRSRQFVLKHHSLESIGRTFDGINRGIGVMPSKLNVSAPC